MKKNYSVCHLTSAAAAANIIIGQTGQQLYVQEIEAEKRLRTKMLIKLMAKEPETERPN